MAPGVEAVTIVKEFLECLNFSLTPQCIDSELKCLTGVLATTNVSFLIGRMVHNLAKLCPDTCRGYSQQAGEEQAHKHINDPDPASVQVIASKAEIDARIAAFICRKQVEVDESNVREFTDTSCGNRPDGMSCARVRPAVVQRRRTHDGHVKLARLQTNTVSSVVTSAEAKARGGTEDRDLPVQQSKMSPPTPSNSAVIRNRCHQLERHVGLPNKPVDTSIYNRLKRIEERVLELEARSPEYMSTFESENRCKTCKSAADLKMYSNSTRISVSHHRTSRSLLSFHPYGQGQCGLLSSRSSSSPGTRRGSVDEDPNASFSSKLREGLGMKPFDFVT